MPVVTSSFEVSARQASAGARRMEHWGARLGAIAPGLAPGGSGGRLAPIDALTFSRVERSVRDGMLWVSDGHCGSRSMIVAARGNAHVARLVAAGRIPPLPEGHAAFAAVRTDVRLHPAAIGLGRPGQAWNFHESAIAQVAGESQPRVLDFLLFDRAVPLSAWFERLGIPPSAAELRGPGRALRPIPGTETRGVLGADAYRAATENLAGAWEHAGRAGWARLIP